jgi:hypothetical protein
MIYLLLAFVILNALDIVTTNAVLRNGGHESNPLTAGLMKVFRGAWGIPKMAITVVIVIILGKMTFGWLPVGVALLLDAAWVYVVYHNYNVYLRQTRKS